MINLRAIFAVKNKINITLAGRGIPHLTVLILLISMLNSVSAIAQPKSGIYGSLLLSNHSSNEIGLNEPKARIGYQTGLFLKTAFNARMHLFSEVGFSNEGYNTRDDDNSVARRIRIRHLLFNTSLNYSLLSKLSIGVGPEISYGIQSQAIFTNTKVDLNDFEVLSFSLNFNLIYKLSEKLDMALRYSHGLSDISEASIADFNTITNIVSFIEREDFKRKFQILIYYKF
ncbi:MAG: outer membrane beta-barrel protein [Bacteroidota bacterium]